MLVLILSDPETEGMSKAAKLIQTQLSKSLHGRLLTNTKSVDEVLIQLQQEQPELNLGLNVTCTVSLGTLKALANSKKLPLYKCKTMIYFSCIFFSKDSRI